MEGEGRIIAMLSVFGLIVWFAYYANTSLDSNSKRDEFLKAREQVESAKKSIASRRGVLDSSKKILADLKEKDQALGGHETAVAALSLSLEKTNKDIKELEESFVSVTRDFVEAVKSVRESAAGREWPEIRLGDGKILTGARIKSVSATEVIFAHALGITRVPLNNLPDDLKLKFRVGMSPMLDIDVANLKASPVIVPNSAPLNTGPKNARPKLMELLAEIARYDLQIAQLESVLQSALARASAPTRIYGKITSAGVDVAKANQEVSALENQISGLTRRLGELRAQLPFAVRE